MNFNDWTNEKYMLRAYEAGAASRQGEIDKLQNRIDEALKALEKLDGYDYNENLDAVFLILEGQSNG